jgi:hypothetical protein
LSRLANVVEDGNKGRQKVKKITAAIDMLEKEEEGSINPT